jgi:hypothetical protein
MLHNDDSSPSVTALGEPWSPWWWTARDLRRPKPGDPSLPSRHPDLILKGPLFLSTADKAASAAEVAKLKKMPSAPAYLAAIAVNWAKSHPHDARVAEALHFAVRCTRFGERDHTSSMLSKEAFMILHHNYARNSWTEETPYYFGS